MAQLAIKGHKTRGSEVIEILEMFGGINTQNLYGDENYAYYTIDSDKEIKAGIYVFDDKNVIIFTLEEFIENFPYKVGDKVLINDDKNDVYTVKSMAWDEDFNRVVYKIEAVDGTIHNNTWFANEMVFAKPKKEESMEEKLMPRIDLTRYCKDKYILDLGNYEIKKENGVTYMIHKKPQYPKTYKECCDVLSLPLYYNLRYHTYEYGYSEFTTINELCSLQDKLNILGKLIICRDAYWKIAGEQMGLSKPWEFKLGSDSKEVVYAISVFGTGIMLDFYYALNCNKILIFPTEEMRNSFYDNFKDLIEQCKELL
jgi:hypothetical protein